MHSGPYMVVCRPEPSPYNQEDYWRYYKEDDTIMNFFSMLNQVEQAAAVGNNNAKTQALSNIPEVEPQPEPEEKPKKKTVNKQKPSEGAGAENIEQQEPAPTENEEEE